MEPEVHLLSGPLTAPVPACGVLTISRGTWQPTLVTCLACQRRLHTPRKAVRPTDPALLVPEKDFQTSVVELARQQGWLTHWVWNSQHSPDGWPDLFLVKDTRAIALELKRLGKAPTAAQQQWLAALANVTSVTAAWGTPEKWDWIQTQLTAGG